MSPTTFDAIKSVLRNDPTLSGSRRRVLLNQLATASAEHKRKQTRRVRRPRILELPYDHSRLGRLLASIKVRQIPGGRWEVRWDIGDWDRDMGLSNRWFNKPCYLDELGEQLMKILYRPYSRRFEMECVWTRWGTVWDVSKDVAFEIAHTVFRFWEKVLRDWKAAEAFASTQIDPSGSDQMLSVPTE
jgi:hypothetical protein